MTYSAPIPCLASSSQPLQPAPSLSSSEVPFIRLSNPPSLHRLFSSPCLSKVIATRTRRPRPEAAIATLPRTSAHTILHLNRKTRRLPNLRSTQPLKRLLREYDVG